MTACDRPVEPLLTAELDDLAGKADTKLARHVRDCPHCRGAARKILAANAALDASLAAGRVLRGDSVIAEARSRQDATRADPAWGSRVSAVRDRVAVVRGAWRWLPAAAAVGALAIAAILFAVVEREEPLPGREWSPDPIASADAARPLLVDAPGYNVAVIPTANPDIKIFWFSKVNDDAHEVDPIRDGPIAIGPGNGL